MNYKTKAVAVDLDGTLCCGGQRLHLMPPPESRWDPLAWEPFHQACAGDTVIADVLELLLAMHSVGYDLIFVSYRSESTRALTMEWLHKHGVPCLTENLYLRPSGDDTPADLFKVMTLQCLQHHGVRIAFMLEDDAKVCSGLRMAGIPAYQVRDWSNPMPGEVVEMPGYTPGASAEKATKPLGGTKDMTIRHEKAFVVCMVEVDHAPQECSSTRPLVLMMEGIGPVQDIGQGEVALDLMAAEDWLERNIDAVCGFGKVQRESVSTLIARGIMIYPSPGETTISALREGSMVYELKSNA